MTMNFSERAKVLVGYAMMALVFSLPFGRKITSPFFIAWIVFSVVLAIIERKKVFEQFRDRPMPAFTLLLIPFVYYLLCVAWLVNTSDMSQGTFELEKKITFLVVPVLAFIYIPFVTVKQLRNILLSFCAGLTVSSLVSISLGFYRSISRVDGKIVFRTAVNDTVYERGDNFFEQVTQGGNYFFGEFISPFIHNTYYGMYLSLGIVVAFALLRWTGKKIIIVPILLMLTTLVFVDSRGAMISFVCSILLASMTMVKRKYALGIAIILVGILYISPRTSLLVKDLKQTVNNLNYNTTESAGLRLIVWRSALEVIGENFFTGVGTGDSEAAMLEKTRDANKLAYENHLNAHNQFLETTIMLGVAGLITLLILLGYPLYLCFKYGDWLFLVFILIIAGNMLFESTFQTFSGLMFFSFFFALFTLLLQKKLYADIASVASR